MNLPEITPDLIDLGGPDGGRYWRVTTGEPADHPDAQNAAVHARVTGSVGATYNDVTVERFVPSKYERMRTVYRVVAADGEILNHGWSIEDRAHADAARHEGARVVPRTYAVEVCASDRVLIDSGIDESAWPLIRAAATRAMNMTRDAGRPSDATRSAVRAYKAGDLTDETFAATRPSGHYPDDVA